LHDGETIQRPRKQNQTRHIRVLTFRWRELRALRVGRTPMQRLTDR
jgi:hypothetical protein